MARKKKGSKGSMPIRDFAEYFCNRYNGQTFGSKTEHDRENHNTGLCAYPIEVGYRFVCHGTKRATRVRHQVINRPKRYASQIATRLGLKWK